MTPVVVHVTGDTGLFGGKDRVLLWLLTALERQGLAAPVVACFRDSLMARTYRDHGLSVVTLPWAFQFDVRAVFRLASLLRARGARIVHTHDHKSHVVGRLAARIAGARVVSTLHGLMADALEMPPYKRVLYGAMVRATDRLTDHWIAVSRSLQAWLGPRRHVTWIPNGIDHSAVAADPDESLPRERGPVVLCVGRLSREKGQDLLLRALPTVASEVPDVVVWLAGEGPTRSELGRMCERLGLEDRVRFLGFRLHVGSLLHRAAVLALPSRGEGLPIAALEAMAAGVPVVATEVGGVPELISRPEVGVLVPPHDPAALARGLLDILTDSRRAREVARAASAHVAAHFSADRMARDTAHVYQALLRGA